MTAKRFTYEYDEYNGNLFDNKMNTFYHIEDSDENIEVLCDRLNWLVEENEQLKFENNILKCALALSDVTFITAKGKKINIPPYYEFEDELRYHLKKEMREYDGYD